MLKKKNKIIIWITKCYEIYIKMLAYYTNNASSSQEKCSRLKTTIF